MPDLTKKPTSPDILEALEKAAHSSHSRNELFEQRVSFVFGAISSDSTVTREQIRRVLSEHAGGADEPIRADGD